MLNFVLTCLLSLHKFMKILNFSISPDCKVCYAQRRSSPRTLGCVHGKYIGYILSAQYFAKNSICRVENIQNAKYWKHYVNKSFWRCANAVTKRKPVKRDVLNTRSVTNWIDDWNACLSCGHIFWLLSHSFHSHINGHLNCLPSTLCKLCNLARLQSLLCAEKIFSAHFWMCPRKIYRIHTVHAILCKKLYL